MIQSYTDQAAVNSIGGVTTDFYIKRDHINATGQMYSKELVYVKQIIPGAKTIIDRPVRLDKRTGEYLDKPELFNAYMSYVNHRQVPKDGTPLSQWGELTDQYMRLLESKGIFTIEQLANLADSTAQPAGGLVVELRRRAQAFLKVKNDADLANRLERDKSELEKQNASLLKRIEALEQQATLKTFQEKVAPDVDNSKGTHKLNVTPEMRREVYNLRLQGVSKNKIAQHLGVSVVTLKTQFADELELKKIGDKDGEHRGESTVSTAVSDGAVPAGN